MSTELQSPIVVGVDGTDQSMLAVRYAVQEAQSLGCGIRLVHAAPEMASTTTTLPLINVETMNRVGERIVNAAKQLAHDITDAEIQVETVIRLGSRVRILTEAGEDARMIVLGHRDRSILGRVFTSSTCTGVGSRARCPVVCVPTVWKPGNPRGRVVIGVEGHEHSQDALAVAFAVAAEKKAKLTVLHAWKLPSPYDDIVVSDAAVEEWRESATEMLEQILQEWREGYPEVEVELDVRHQHIAPALMGATEGADLLVLGRRGRGAPLGFHLGSTARTLIRESRCPVEIAPPRHPEELFPSQRLMTADQVSPQT